MNRRLIINADDFGLTPGVNQAVLELHQAGALPSATLMATGLAFAQAAETARQHPSLGIGCHVVLTDGTPVLPGKAIPSLLGGDGKSFRPSLIRFVAAVLLGRVRESEIAAEAEAQIRRLQGAGLRVTHADTHKHTHLFPLVGRALLQAMERTGVRALRNPFEPRWSLRLAPGSRSRRLQLFLLGKLRRRFEELPAIRDRRVLTTDGTIGISATGHLNREALHRLLELIPEGTWELVCHPGYNDLALDRITTRLRSTRETERLALLHELGPTEASSQPALRHVELIRFDQL